MRAAVVVLALIAAVSAQTACIIQCSSTAGQANGCPNFADAACVCKNIPFQTAVGACITTTCPGDLAAAQALQAALCGGASSGAGSTPAGTAPASTAVGGGATTSAGAPVPTKSNPASSLNIPLVVAGAVSLISGAIVL